MENSSAKIRIGVMGCAAIAQRSVIPAIISHPDFELVSIASRSKEKADAFSRQFNCKALYSYEALLDENVDAIYLPLPTGVQYKWALSALKHDKHLLAEKSLGLSNTAVNDITGAAEEHNRIVMEDFMFQYHSQQKWLQDQLSSGVIGDVREFRASFGFPGLQKGNFRYDAELGGGALLDAGAYTVKASQLVFGNDLNVEASILQYDKKHGSADISGSALLTSPSGVPLQLSWGFQHFYQCGYQIWGSKGKLTTFRSFTSGPDVVPTARIETPNQTCDISLGMDNHFKNILSEFQQRILLMKTKESANELRQQADLLQIIRTKATNYYA